MDALSPPRSQNPYAPTAPKGDRARAITFLAEVCARAQQRTAPGLQHSTCRPREEGLLEELRHRIPRPRRSLPSARLTQMPSPDATRASLSATRRELRVVRTGQCEDENLRVPEGRLPVRRLGLIRARCLLHGPAVKQSHRPAGDENRAPGGPRLRSFVGAPGVSIGGDAGPVSRSPRQRFSRGSLRRDRREGRCRERGRPRSSAVPFSGGGSSASNAATPRRP